MTSPRIPLARVLVVWLVLAAILLARALPALAERRFPDPDDVLRLVQLRDLMGGQGWFDLHQYRIDGPQGTLMHWSRLVDLPLLLVTGALAPLIGIGAAEQVAVVLVPLLTLAAILLAVAKTASRFMDATGVTFACLCVGLSPLLLAQVQPLRIDHHGWQIFTAILAMTGMVPGRRAWGPAFSGAVLAAGLSISLEILPVAAAFGGVFALRWLGGDRASAPLVAFLAGLTATLTALFLATRGLGDLAQHCDAVSPALIGFFAIVAAGAALVARAGPRPLPVLVLLLGLPVVAGAAFYAQSAPQCLSGPFGTLDPLVHDFWYRNVAEGQPTWRLSPAIWLPVVAQGLIAIGTVAWLWRRSTADERQWWFEYLVVLCVSFITGLLVWRSQAFVGVFSAIPLGWLAARLLRALRETDRAGRKLAVALTMLVVLVPAFPVAMLMAIAPRAIEVPSSESPNASAACRLADSADALNRLPPAKIFAPLDLGPALLDRSHHTVIATAHHRANLAMRDVIAAFLGTPDAARALIESHDADYVLVCTPIGEMSLYARRAPDGFAARLADGRVPEWLEPVALEGPQEARLWRVRRGGTAAPAR